MDRARTHGARVKKERKRKGWTQSELGAEVGVGGDTVSRWENGILIPPKHRQLTLRKVLGISVKQWPLEKSRPVGPKPHHIDIDPSVFEVTAQELGFAHNLMVQNRLKSMRLRAIVDLIAARRKK